MTTTITPNSTIACAEVSPGLGPVASGRHFLHGFGQQLVRQSARLWGSGSVTPSSQVLDAIGAPSFHR